MNIKNLLLFAITILCSTHAYSMEQPAIIQTNNKPTWLAMPKEIWTYIIAHYHIKDDLRKTCTYLHKLASSTNTDILTHPLLVLSEKALKQCVLYHTASGDTAIVRNLLDKGANPNACDDKQMTLMHYAAQCGYIDIVDMLLEHPALIKTNLIKGRQSPFDLAIQRDQGATVKQIVSACKVTSENALYYAAGRGALNCVRTLLSRDIDPNCLNCSLLLATEQGDIHIIKLLIANGALVNCRDYLDKNHIDAFPLHFAASRGHTSAVQLLIDYGAHVNKKTNDGNTSLDIAKNDHVKQLLIEHGGKTNAELKRLELKENKPKKPKNANCVVQ